MQGRGLGTAGLELAAQAIEGWMRGMGLAVAGSDETLSGHRQPFEVVTGVTLGDGNHLTTEDGDLELGSDFTPLAFSSSQSFTGDLVFAGYGIRAESLGYDDYAGQDVTGKVVLALRYEPGERDDASPFNGRRPTRWSELRFKALMAREAGASALILVSGPTGDESDEPDRLPVLRAEGPTSEAGIPVIQVSRRVADEWLARGGHDLRTLQQTIDTSYTPQTTSIPGLNVTGRVELVTSTTTVANVVGVLPGAGALSQEAVVVGAHYDHLGYGGPSSMAPDSDEVHNGADDNASGVAAMLCAVEGLISRSSDGDRRTLIVAAFTAEEVGLGGSSWYVAHPVRPLDGTVAMINLDMVGRVRDNTLSVLGTDSAEEWDDWLAGPGQTAGLVLNTGGDGYGPSDQMSFYTHEIPVLHLFSGAHDAYHTPSDDIETLNPEGGAQVATLLSSLLGELLTQDARPTYAPPSQLNAMIGDSRGYGAYLGTIPDYTEMSAPTGEGVLLSGVRPGGPADRAGVRGGDRLIQLGEWQIANLYDMTYALQDHRPGEVVRLIVRRDGEPVTLSATVGSRAATPPEDEHHGSAATSMPSWSPSAGTPVPHLLDPAETHLSDLRQLTFGGENAEGYFSPDGRRLVFQATPPGAECDQQYIIDLDSGEITTLSSGRGRTTCGYYAYPDGERLIYATTEHVDEQCPAPPDRSQGYVWPLYDFDLVWQSTPESPAEPFLPTPAYDAEATVCPVDGRIVFTSTRDGDLDLYIVRPDGSDLEQVTDVPGYDGGAFFSSDCRYLVWRASRPEGDALSDYRRLLADRLVRPGALDIIVRDLETGEQRQLTDNGAANFAPYPAPDNSGILFASNAGSSPREFDIWWVPMAGGELTQVTHSEGFDGFPVFSPDGQWLVFGSNRGGDGRETNLFIARWNGI